MANWDDSVYQVHSCFSSGDWIQVSNILNVIFTDKNTFGEQGNHGPGFSHTSFKYVKLLCPNEILNIANVVSVLM